MESAAALRLAIELVLVPTQVRRVRSQPLPGGVALLLRIAAGDPEAEAEAAYFTARPPDVVRRAAAFFIEQILLSAEADSYRVLGATPQATGAELRRNMALLLRWLHPDMDRRGERSVLAKRVIKAWDTLKTPERRAAYDKSQTGAPHTPRSTSGRHRGATRYARKQSPAGHPVLYWSARSSLLRRGLAMLLGRPQP